MLTANEIRNSFKSFFESKGHQIVPSAPMVIKDDPTPVSYTHLDVYKRQLPTSANSIIIRLTIWDMPCKITCW